MFFLLQIHLVTLNASNNCINLIENSAFTNLHDLQILDLNYNEINVLTSRLIFNLKNIIFLKIYKNPLKHLDPHLFKYLVHVQLVLTENFRICCIRPNKKTICTAAVEWPASCEDLISNNYINMSIWFVTLAVVLLNLSSFINLVLSSRRKSNKRTCFKIIARTLNICDCTCGVHMMFIAGANAYFKGSFALSDLYWRGHIACKAAANIFTFF